MGTTAGTASFNFVLAFFVTICAMRRSNRDAELFQSLCQMYAILLDLRGCLVLTLKFLNHVTCDAAVEFLSTDIVIE